MITSEAGSLRAWLAGRLPTDWFSTEPTLRIDRDEILIIGTLTEPDLPGDVTDADRATARAGRVKQFREDTRDRRITIARELEHSSGRKVGWGVELGGKTDLFTSLAAPTMTRLRQAERQVLDTLVDAGVARSRADALAWCVKLVGQHSQSWLGDLRSAMEQVEKVRDQGPDGVSS